MSSPSKISGLPLGTVTSDDYLVYVDRADGTTKKAEVSQVSGGNGKTSYIFSSVNSDIGGYESMPSLTSYTIGALGTVSQTTNTTATLLASFVTPIGFPNVTVIPEGLFTSHFETQKSAGSNNYHTFFELYKRTVGGAETLLATSDNSTSSATNTVQSVSLTALLTSNVTLALTDRIVIKVYAQMTSGSATITLRYDDGTNARLEMVSSLVDASNFIPYTGATQNVNLGANSIIAVNLNGTLSGTNTGDQTITTSVVTATASQTVFTAPTYVIGNSKLEVYNNGLLQYITTDYTETSTTSITFGTGLTAGDIVKFRVLS